MAFDPQKCFFITKSVIVSNQILIVKLLIEIYGISYAFILHCEDSPVYILNLDS